MIENLTPKFSKKPIKIIGCGLAGAEVAFILANNGFDVHIFDNEENIPTEKFEYYNKYETYMTENMKFELDCLNSPLFSIAKKYNFNNFGFEYDETFMFKVKSELASHNRIQIFKANIHELSKIETTVIATGHNTNKDLIKDLEKYIGKQHVCYYQPEKLVISTENIDFSKLNFVSKTVCYANLNQFEYDNFYNKVIYADKMQSNRPDFEDEKQITIEHFAKRGQSGLRNAVLRPYFDKNTNNGEKPYASLKMIYNIKENVFILDDFYTFLNEKQQQEILGAVSVLKNCNIINKSNIKRKTYLLTPTCINENLQIDNHENFYVCGGFLGTAGSLESLLMANFCAYSIICDKLNKQGLQLLTEKTCISYILKNLIEKSVVNFRLFNLKYDIINLEDLDMQYFDKQVEIQKFLSKSQIEKFKEKFYGKYF